MLNLQTQRITLVCVMFSVCSFFVTALLYIPEKAFKQHYNVTVDVLVCLISCLRRVLNNTFLNVTLLCRLFIIFSVVFEFCRRSSFSTILEPAALINSPNYPFNYNNLQLCTLELIAPFTSAFLEVHLIYFDLESRFDYLRITHANGTNSYTGFMSPGILDRCKCCLVSLAR